MWQRALIALWSLWLVAALCEPMELHACPMHDHAAMAGMAGMDMGTPGAARARHAPATDEHSAPAAVCTCLGVCSGASNVGAPEPIFALRVHIVRQRSNPPQSGKAAPSIARAYALPFATAPPEPATPI